MVKRATIRRQAAVPIAIAALALALALAAARAAAQAAAQAAVPNPVRQAGVVIMLVL